MLTIEIHNHYNDIYNRRLAYFAGHSVILRFNQRVIAVWAANHAYNIGNVVTRLNSELHYNIPMIDGIASKVSYETIPQWLLDLEPNIIAGNL